MGSYTSVPTWWRSLDGRYRLELGRCPECGTHNFPARGACRDCGSRSAFERVEPSGAGTVEAATVIEGSAPPEFAELLDREGAVAVVIVGLDEGARVPAMMTDCDPHAVERGDRVEATIRRIYDQEGVVRYGTKFRPVRE